MISAIVLAAGQSTRMGEQKLLLPWAHTTVIGQVVSTLDVAGIKHILLVTGANEAELKSALKGYQFETLFNKDFDNGEMLTSVQVGILGLNSSSEAALIVLGDQPQIEARIIQAIIERTIINKQELVIPSYQMHRGHPWLVGCSYWLEILQMQPPDTLQNFLIRHNDEISYLDVDTPSVIQDLDTRADYERYKPGTGNGQPPLQT